jgi:hypothetical protein
VSFTRNVFINCPFDDAYLPLLRPLLFTVICVGLVPRIASERLDSGQPRIHKITSLIRQSKYAIHDLSRLQAKKKGEFFRLNMPLELGIDFGCKTFGAGKLRRKCCLILESEPYRFQATVSDFSGSDIRAHNDKPQDVVVAVRNWLHNEANLDASSATKIWTQFNQFMADNYENHKAKGFSDSEIQVLPVKELMKAMKAWVKKFQDSEKAG